MKSESIAKLSEALCKAQAEMPAAKMLSENPYFKSKYADLGEIIQSARKPLADNGLSFVQPISGDDFKVTVTTILMHQSGEYIGDSITMTIPDDKGKAVQAAGSIITYLRRYSLASMLGIYADEDKDGNQNDGKQQQSQQKEKPIPAQAKPAAPTMTLEEAEGITNRDGIKYKEIETPTLSMMFNSMEQALKRNDLAKEYREETTRKAEAARLILESRKDK